MKIVLIALFSLLSSQAFAQQNLQLVSWFAGADIVGNTGSTEADLNGDFYVREFELSAFAAIDQTFDGILTLAYHNELQMGEEHLEVHEGFLFSSKLFNLSTVKIGKFFMGFGRLNRFHRHDWVFTEAPLVQKSFFGNEGAKDTGFEIKRNLVSIGSTLTVGLTSGNEFNHNEDHDHDHSGSNSSEEHDHSKMAKTPTTYLRYAKFWDFSTTRGLEVGLNYVNRMDAESKKYQYSGLDLVYKNRVGKFVQTLIQAEIWARTLEHEHDGEEEKHNDLGAYVYLEKGIDQHHAWGVRLDYYSQDHREEEAGSTEEHDHKIDGVEVDGDYSALTLAYIYTNSEFMRTRISVEHAQGIHVEGHDDVDSYTKGMLQFVFSIGAHPAHVY